MYRFRWIVPVLIIASLPIIWADGGPKADPFPTIEIPSDPFWKKSDAIYDRIREQRAILVSVKTQNLNQAQSRLKQALILSGAGWVSAPPAFAFEVLKKFQHWSKMSEYIEASKYTPSSEHLFLHFAAFNYHARMRMKVKTEENSDVKKIRFHVVGGSFKGMIGTLGFQAAKGRKSEIFMTAHYEFDKLPMPEFFIEFGLEIVFQKMAEKMRAYIEDQYKQNKTD